MSGDWQPIETAPKDGTLVDLWSSAACRRVVNARWQQGRDVDPRCAPEGVWHHLEATGWRLPSDTDGCGCLIEDQFTHWMLLPNPPQVKP
jgi:hypothetical protein